MELNNRTKLKRSHSYPDYGANSRIFREVCGKICKIRVRRFYDFTASVQARDLRRTFKSTKHKDDAPIVLEMRRCLRSAARVILISDREWTKNFEGITAFG